MGPEPASADRGSTYVVGVGVSSSATVAEVGSLVTDVLILAGVPLGSVRAVATVDSRATHPAVAALGLPVVSYGRDVLPPRAVAEPAALLAAGRNAELVVAKQRSAGATAALARGVGEALLPPGDHGGDGARLARQLGLAPGDVLDLSQSLNPVAPDPTPIVARHVDAVARYPDAAPATAALAEAIEIDRSLVVLTNGGAEAIALVAAELGWGWVDEPDFSLYRRHLPRLDRAGPRFRSNPHSPTGVLAGPGERAAVWDEAFYPLATGRWTSGAHADGSIVVGSLTKLFACPGLRLGYVLAPDPATADAIRARQPRWSVGSIAVEALPELLATADLAAWVVAAAALRRQLVGLLDDHSLRAEPADANWVLVADAQLRDQLLPHGIVVRDCASFGRPGTVRIAVPDAAGLERLAAALRRVRR